MWLNTTKTCSSKNVLRHLEALVLATSGQTRSLAAIFSLLEAKAMVCGSGPLSEMIAVSAEQNKP